MFKTRKTTAIASASAALAVIVTFATAPASQPDTPSAPVAETIAQRPNTAPTACDGQAWPYQSSGCIAAIMAENGREPKQVRIVALYETGPSPIAQAYAELARELRPTR